MIASFAMLLAVAAWLLSTGPVSLSLLTPYLKEALTLGQADIRVELDDTILTWAGWDRTLDIRAIGVRLLNKSGVAIAVIPEVSLGLSGRALLDKRVVPTTLDLLRPTLRLLRTRDGRLDLGMGTRIGATASETAVTFVEALLNPSVEDRRDGFLSRISILNADVILVDQSTKTTWRAPWADISLLRTETGVDGTIVADAEIGDATTRITVNGRFDAKDKKIALDVLLADFEPARLASHMAEFEPLKAFVAPVSGTLALTLFEDGKYSPLAFDLTGGPGLVSLPTIFPGKIVFSQMATRGAVVDSFTAIRVDELFVDAGGPYGTVRGLASIDLKAKNLAFGGTMEGEFHNVPINDLSEYWPTALAPPAREWVTASLHDGRVTNGKVRLTVRPEDFEKGTLPNDAVDLVVEFEGVSSNYLEGLPELKGSVGTAHLTADVLDVALSRGRVADLDLTEGKVHLVGLNGDAPTADISFVASGPVSTGMKILDLPPFEFAKSLNLDPESLTGQMAARALLAFPLQDVIEIDDVQFAAAANVREFAMSSGIGGYALSGGSLVTNIDANGMDIEGNVEISGVPSTVKWHKNFHGDHAEYSNLSVSLVLDDKARKTFEVPELPWLSGPVSVNGEFIARGWQIASGGLALNLATTKLDLPELFWNKPVGTPAQANIRFNLPPVDPASGDKVSTAGTKATFSYAGGGLDSQGEIEVGPDHELRRLDLSGLKFGESEFAASIRPLAPKGYIVALEGERFDMRPYVDRLMGDAKDSELPPLKLSARLRRLFLSDEYVLDNMEGQATYDGANWRQMAASGTMVSGGTLISDGAPINVALTSGADKSTFSVTSSNGGAFLRSLGVFGNAIGGNLDVLATIDQSKEGWPARGRVRMSDFRVVDSPTLANILTTGSLPEVADILGDEGIRFVQFQAPFRIVDLLNGQIIVRGGRAIGPTMGVTMAGVIDRTRQKVGLKGTLIPAYTINSVLGKIPILGPLLTGGKGEGIFGITYEVTGPLSNPETKVFPASVLAPGVLRKLLFDFPDLIPENSDEEEKTQ